MMTWRMTFMTKNGFNYPKGIKSTNMDNISKSYIMFVRQTAKFAQQQARKRRNEEVIRLIRAQFKRNEEYDRHVAIRVAEMALKED